MTEINKHNNNEYIDKNLDRLLKQGVPIPVMPEEIKDRIRSRLIQISPESSRKRIFPFRWVALPLTAAAVFIFFILFPWQYNLSGSITWADVQKHFDNIHTIAGKVDIITSINGESRIISSARIYHKDPGLTRSEIYEPYTDLDTIKPLPQLININKRKPGFSELLTLHADSRQAEWRTQIYRTTGPDKPPKQIIDLASENWKLMSKITGDKTNHIGTRVINGIPAIGFIFECPVQDCIVDPNAIGDANGKIFVKREDGVPVFIEVEYPDKQGQKIRIEANDIQWNEPLEKNLFDFSVPEGWHLNRTRIETAEYTNTKLKPGINLYAGRDGEKPLLTVNDVIGVIKVEETTNPNSKIPHSMNITIELEQATAEILHKEIDTHPKSIIVVDFNKQEKVITMLDKKYPQQLTFDLSRLGYSLSEFEKQYLTKTTTIFKGDE